MSQHTTELIYEACIGVLGILRIFAILLPGIWDTVFSILVTSRDIEYLRTLIMGIFASLR